MKKIGGLVLTFAFLFLLILSFSFISAGELQVTQEHPFLINGNWMPAKDLVVGDILQTSNGGRVRITGIENIISEEPFLVYNFEDTFGINNYIVNGGDGVGVVVHNSNQDEISSFEGFFRKKQFTETNFGQVYERQWGSKFPFEGRVEKILIDKPDPVLEARIKVIYDETFGKLSSNPSESSLETAIMNFDHRSGQELPFLGADNKYDAVQTDAYWIRYLDQFRNGPKKLSELGATKMLDCTGQGLTIKQSLPTEGWKLYTDVPFDSTTGQWLKTKLRVHTFLAKRYGNKVAIIDPTEGLSIPPSTHGFVRDWSEFVNIYPEANIVSP